MDGAGPSKDAALPSEAGTSGVKEVTPESERVVVEDDVNKDEEDLTEVEIEVRIWRLQARLRQMRQKRSASAEVLPPSPALDKPQDEVFRYMMNRMEDENARGFVYGIVGYDGTPVSGCSGSLKTWWDKIQFDRNGPAAVHKYRNYARVRRNCANGVGRDQASVSRTLLDLPDTTLGSFLSVLMQHCDPPQRKFPLEKGVPPPWWPTTVTQEWWEEIGYADDLGPPPYRKPHDLRKPWKVCVLIAILDYMAPDFRRMKRAVNGSKCLQGKMTAKTMELWNSVISQQRRLFRGRQDGGANGNEERYGGSSSSNDASDDDVNINTGVVDQMLPDRHRARNPPSIFGMPNNYNVCAPSGGQRSAMELVRQGTRMMAPEGPSQMRRLLTCDHPRCPHSEYRYEFRDEETLTRHLYSCTYRMDAMRSGGLSPLCLNKQFSSGGAGAGAGAAGCRSNFNAAPPFVPAMGAPAGGGHVQSSSGEGCSSNVWNQQQVHAQANMVQQAVALLNDLLAQQPQVQMGPAVQSSNTSGFVQEAPVHRSHSNIQVSAGQATTAAADHGMSIQQMLAFMDSDTPPPPPPPPAHHAMAAPTMEDEFSYLAHEDMGAAGSILDNNNNNNVDVANYQQHPSSFLQPTDEDSFLGSLFVQSQNNNNINNNAAAAAAAAGNLANTPTFPSLIINSPGDHVRNAADDELMMGDYGDPSWNQMEDGGG